MATRLPSVDALLVGFGWTGAILAQELTDAGINVLALERGENLIVFPEGTRTPIGGRGKMRRGAANIAVRGRRDITPVTISCVPIGLAKSQAWWQVPPRPMCFRIRVRDDLAIAPFLTGAHGDARAARELTEFLEHYFENP